MPFERPPQFGTRQFLTDAEYAQRMEDVRLRDERDLARVDVLSGFGRFAASATTPRWHRSHWRTAPSAMRQCARAGHQQPRNQPEK